MEIKDSGERRTFETGAVRDIQEGKGLPHVMPLAVMAGILNDSVMYDVARFNDTGNPAHLESCLSEFCEVYKTNYETLFLDVATHYEAGLKKYGIDEESGLPNWMLGIPTSCYVDSMVRHYLKYLREDTDEDHYRSFVWNVLSCLWTCRNKPELNDLEARYNTSRAAAERKINPVEFDSNYAKILDHIGNSEDDRK